MVDTGLADRGDEQVISGAWNLPCAICDPVSQYQTGELIHTVAVAQRATDGASHYFQSGKSGEFHTDGTLLDTAPEIAMLAGVQTELGYAARKLDVPGGLTAAMEALDLLAEEPAHQAPLLIRRGYVLFRNNQRCLHGRRPFRESLRHRRLIRGYGMRRGHEAGES